MKLLHPALPLHRTTLTLITGIPQPITRARKWFTTTSRAPHLLPKPICYLHLTASSPASKARMSTSTQHIDIPPPPKVTTAGDMVESAKRAAGLRAVADHLLPTFTHVGIGSGSTIKYVVEAIAALPTEQTSRMKFVPTGIQSRDLIRAARLPLLAIDDLVLEKPYEAGQQYLDVCFDGADEVDLELNCIKGGGACHYQEKLVAKFSKKFICVADYRKKVDQLLTNWPGVPIEVQPLATEAVRRELITMGSIKPYIRSGLPGKAGHIVTDNGNHVIDAPFPPLLLNSEKDKMDPSKGLWTVDALAARIKSITGVLEIGIFSGPNGPQAKALGKGGEKPIIVYFGMQDGTVETREFASN
ncbi:ribose 5-phosphate isomerase A-domain-containing protein [Xylariales sp. PMI_506]|nr:ribose 5-phosphate isomerase A-domain-containing protein [Xylariales sp. PMI_506]